VPASNGSTCDGSPSLNGNGNGNADNKNPPGQAPNGSDHNAG